MNKALRRTAGLSAMIFPFYALWYWKQLLLFGLMLAAGVLQSLFGGYDGKLRESMSDVALDDTSCIALTAHLEGSDPVAATDLKTKYDQVVLKGRILSLPAGTKVKEGQVLNAVGQKVFRAKPDEVQDGSLSRSSEMMIVTPVEGKLKGQQVCVPGDSVDRRFTLSLQVTLRNLRSKLLT